MIYLGEHHDGDETVISLDDLAVTADHTQLSLGRISTGEQIRPWVLHALETSVQTPPLARFLAEVPSARCGFYGLFDFGAAREMPFLPRVRYGRAVLSPAQWQLSRSDLPSADTSWSAWDTALSDWRDRWQIPSTMMLVERELRLPLDLDDQRDRTLLRRRLNRNRTSQVLLRETGDYQDHAWAGRVCELLVPLTATLSRTAAVDNRPPIVIGPQHTVAPSDAQLPGNSTVLRADLLGHPWRFDDMLTGHLTDLFDAVDGHLTRWWFSRHHDTARPDSDQHLVLFLRLSGQEEYGVVAARLADWAAQLSAGGLLADLTLGTYQPSPGIYGNGRAIEAAAEEVFAADSDAAMAQLKFAAATGLPGQAIAAASMAQIAASLAVTPEAGYCWLCDILPQEHGKLDISLRSAALRLVSGDVLAELRGLSSDRTMISTWDQRREALAAYLAQGGAHSKSSAVLRALLHDHHLRAVGVDPGAERVTNRLARVIAQRQAAQLRRRLG